MTLRRPTVLVAAAVALALALGGAAAFGLWHVVVGGLLHGNVRAGEFGLGLAVLSTALLVGLVFVVRRGLARRRG